MKIFLQINSIASATEVSDSGIGNRVSQLEKENQDLRNSMYISKKLKNKTNKLNICKK